MTKPIFHFAIKTNVIFVWYDKTACSDQLGRSKTQNEMLNKETAENEVQNVYPNPILMRPD